MCRSSRSAAPPVGQVAPLSTTTTTTTTMARTGSLGPPSAPRDRRVRIGDAERDSVVGLLGAAFSQGYLDRSELDARTERALAATTTDELDALRQDLPRRLDPAVADAARARQQIARRAARGHLTSYAAGVALMLGIWLVAAVAFGATYFWPVWPILGWGIGVASRVLPARRELGGSAGSGSGALGTSAT